MRSRLLIMFALIAGATAAVAAPAYAAINLAQAESGEGTEVENEGGDLSDPGTDTGEGADGSEGGEGIGEGGEGEADAETGAGEDEQAPATEEEEEGPQWTYQMSKITLVMLLLLFLAMGALYYRMIARRQRGV